MVTSASTFLSLPDELKLMIVEQCMKAGRPGLPDVAVGDSFARRSISGQGLKNLALTSKEMHGLVKDTIASLERNDEPVLLATGLEPPSDTAGSVELSKWNEGIGRVKHLVFATRSVYTWSPYAPSFASAKRLLEYLSTHGSSHSIKTITFDERIEDKFPTDEAEVRMKQMIGAAKKVALSKSDEVCLQLHLHRMMNRDPTYTLWDPSDSYILRSGVSWGSRFMDAPKYTGKFLSSDLTRRYNFDLARSETVDCVADFGTWCRRTYQDLMDARRVSSVDNPAVCAATVNLYAAECNPPDEYYPLDSNRLPVVIMGMEDVRRLKERFETVANTVRDEEPREGVSLTVNCGVRDLLPYDVVQACKQ